MQPDHVSCSNNNKSLWDAIPTLETERLVLRPIVAEDRGAIFKNFSDIEVSRWFSEVPYTVLEQIDEVIETFRQRFERGEGLTWAIVSKADRQLIGTCGYEKAIPGSSGEIGYDLGRAYWGLGYMQEALRTVIAYSFQVLDLQEIIADTYTANQRSVRLLERLGFRLDRVEGDASLYTLTRAGRSP